MSTIAIIAALDRELAPLVRSWRSTRIAEDRSTFRVFQHHNVVAVAGGIGCRAATLAATAMVRNYKPKVLISAGLAGALVESLQVGSVITPSVVINAETGKQYRSESGEGVLVTFEELAGSASKQSLAGRFHASAVDMEATAVAEVAQQEGITFRCVKAISDDAVFEMPPLNRFINQQGRFQSGSFIFWLMTHPQYWHRTLILARNSNRAAVALCKWLEQHACKMVQSESVGKIKGAELSQINH
jgi:adenosylhomocysteine nucleosidase